MKFGFRMPSLKKRISARTSWKRIIRHRAGVKAPRGFGLLTDPKRAAYNRIYSRTSIGAGSLFGGRSSRGCGSALVGAGLLWVLASPVVFWSAVASLVGVSLVILAYSRSARNRGG